MTEKEAKYYNIRPDSSYYKVYDRNGHFLAEISREQAKLLSSDAFLYGVTCFVISKNKDGNWDVLMEMRANTELTPGKIDLVSGHIDGNETPTQTVLRELHEEVGIENLDYTQINRLEKLPKLLGFESKGKINSFFIYFYCYVSPNHSYGKVQQEEVAALKWVPLEDAFEMLRAGKTKFPKQNKNVNYEEIFSNIRKLLNEREQHNSRKSSREKEMN